MNRQLSTDGWENCPTGVLQELASNVRAKRRNQSLVRAGITTALVLLALFVGYQLVVQRGNESLPGGLTCQRVQELRVDYQANRLDPSLRRQVQQHLTQCPDCRKVYGLTSIEVGTNWFQTSVALLASGNTPPWATHH